MPDPQGRPTRPIPRKRSNRTAGNPHFPMHDSTSCAFENTGVLLDAMEGRKNGGILTIKVVADGATTSQVAGRLELFSSAPSSRDAEIQPTQPITTHHRLSANERDRRGIPDSPIRLALVLEDRVDLFAEQDQALDVVIS